MSQWTKASEALPPEEDKLYLVFINTSVAFARFQKDGNGLWQFNKADVTHWMEVPEGPKDEEKSVPMEMES